MVKIALAKLKVLPSGGPLQCGYDAETVYEVGYATQVGPYQNATNLTGIPTAVDASSYSGYDWLYGYVNSGWSW